MNLIITFAKELNYGAVLQAYALQETLRKYKETKLLNYDLTKKKFFQYQLKHQIFMILTYFKNRKKQKSFQCFFDNYLTLTNSIKNKVEVEQEADQYENVITGSDQVWNNRITGTDEDIFLLNFSLKKAHKSSYAASLASEKVDKKELEKMKKILTEYSHISVREKELEDLLQPICEQKISTVVDPTLLLTKEEWIQKFNLTKNNKRYILVYALGNNPVLIDIVNKISKEKNLEIVTFDYLNRFEVKEEKQYAANPRDFVELIYNAEYVITNSFHGTVFSAILEKNFVTILNHHRNVRQQNLLKNLNLEKRKVSSIDEARQAFNEKIDYNKVKESLSQKQRESFSYIEVMIGSKE